LPDPKPAPELLIRPAREQDIPAIFSLIHALGEYEKAPAGAISVTEDLLRESLFGSSPAAEILLAFVGNDVAGFAMFFQNYSSWRGRIGIYLEDLFVQAEWRRHGVGKALLLALARIALERGCTRMDWMVLDWNEPAIEFYRSLGAAPLDEWTRFRLTEDALRALVGS
jgi:GNAT superfamily N-acetyltransferase